jgi:hypothetical protein
LKLFAVIDDATVRGIDAMAKNGMKTLWLRLHQY